MGESFVDTVTFGASRKKRETAQTNAQNLAIAEQKRLEEEEIARERQLKIDATEAGQETAGTAKKRGRGTTVLTRRGGLGSVRGRSTLLGRS